jgi:hypothetical protein
MRQIHVLLSQTGLPDFSPYNVPKRWKYYQMMTQYTKWPQIRRKKTKIFYSKALQILPKLGFMEWKYSIWQPCPQRRQTKFWLVDPQRQYFRLIKPVRFERDSNCDS